MRRVMNKELKLTDREWREFKFKDVFHIVDGYYNKKPPMEENGTLPFLGATQYNNGITGMTTKASVRIHDKVGGNSMNDVDKRFYAGGCIAITNNGSVNVSGEHSIGLLGMAYRVVDANGQPVDKFGAGAIGQGMVNIVNKGSVDLDGQGAIGMFAKNNKLGTTFTNAIALNDTTGVITTTGDKAVGMAGEEATLTNRGTINVNGEYSLGMYASGLGSKAINEGEIYLTERNSIGMIKPMLRLQGRL